MSHINTVKLNTAKSNTVKLNTVKLRSPHLLLLWWLVIAGMPHSIHAQTKPETLPSGYGLMIGLPGARTELAGMALLSPPADLVTASKVPLKWLDSTDALWLTPLRRTLHAEELIPTLAPKCKLETPQFSTVLDDLEDSINYLDFAQAQGNLWLVDVAFSCDPDPIPPAQLARYAFLAGLMEQRKSHTDGGWFRVAAALDPQLKRFSLESPAVRLQFRTEVQEVKTTERVTMPVHLDQAGLTLWIDGVPATEPEVSLIPGVHFIQLVDQKGRAIRGALERVDAPTRSALPHEVSFPPQSIEVPHGDVVVRRLEESVRVGRVDDVVAVALRGLLGSGRHPWVLLVTPQSVDQPARGLWVLAGGAAIPVRLTAEIPRAGVIGTGALAATTLASGIGLAYFLSPLLLNGGLVRDPSAQATAVVGTGIGTVVSLSAMGFVASHTWRIPRSLYQNKAARALEHKP